MIKIFLLEVRRSWLVWLVAPIAVLWLWMVFARVGDWRGSWIGATTYAASPGDFVAVAIGAVVGGSSAARRRSNFRGMARTSCRAAMSPVIIRISALLALALSPLVLGFAVVGVFNRRIAQGGFFDLGYMAYAVVGFTTLVLLADLVGLITTSVVAGPVLGASLALASLFYAGSPLSTAPDMEMSPSILKRSFLLLLLVLLAAVSLPAILIRARSAQVKIATQGGAIIVLVLACAFFIGAGDADAGGQTKRARPAAAHCGGSAPRVCVWPDHAPWLAAVQPLADRVADAGRGVFPVPNTFREYGLVDGGEEDDGFHITYSGGPALWWTAGSMGDQLLNAVVAPNYCDPASAQDAARENEMTEQVALWLQAKAYGSGQPDEIQGYRPDTTKVDHVLRQPLGQQQIWAKTTLAQILATPCA